MKYLKTCNEVYYIDFDIKDYKKFAAEHRNNPRKIDIRIIPNNLDEYHFLEGLIPLIQYIKKYNLKGIVRVLIITGGSSYSKEYIRLLLDGYERYYTLIGGDFSFVYKNEYIHISKDYYILTINSYIHLFMGYGHNNKVTLFYEDGFYKGGTNGSILKESIDHDKKSEVYAIFDTPRRPLDELNSYSVFISIHERKMERLKNKKSCDTLSITIQ